MTGSQHDGRKQHNVYFGTSGLPNRGVGEEHIGDRETNPAFERARGRVLPARESLSNSGERGR